MQDIRNKDFVKETIPKIKGDITHEQVFAFTTVLKEDEEFEQNILQTARKQEETSKMVDSLSDPTQAFRRRVTVNFNSSDFLFDCYKANEDHSHLNVAFKPDNKLQYELLTLTF